MKNNSMDFLNKSSAEKICISDLQRSTQQDVISKYKEARKSQKMTQVELAAITGIPQPNITRFESNISNPTLEMLVKMAAALGKKIVFSLEDLEDKPV